MFLRNPSHSCSGQLPAFFTLIRRSQRAAEEDLAGEKIQGVLPHLLLKNPSATWQIYWLILVQDRAEQCWSGFCEVSLSQLSINIHGKTMNQKKKVFIVKYRKPFGYLPSLWYFPTWKTLNVGFLLEFAHNGKKNARSKVLNWGCHGCCGWMGPCWRIICW